ncbi:TPA: protoporphyrinogen oxidase HemJ [Klebsiella pneumoniae]
MLYLWIKALHIIALVCWFAGLFYLPRLFVYHATAADAPSQARFVIMERKLYRGIMWPSMIVTLLCGGGLLLLNPGWLAAGWLHQKLLLVTALVVYQLACGRMLKRFASGNNSRGHVFYRWFNEVPVLFLLAIVVLVVVKPF